MCLIKGIHLFGVGVVQELFVKKAMKKIVTRIREDGPVGRWFLYV